jgi:hypothetical protein
MEVFGGNIKNCNNMKTKGLILLLLIFCCISCDKSIPFVIDGQKEYVASSECGTIKVRGSTLFPTSPILIGCTFNGQYHINTDSLKMEAIPNEVAVTNVRFQLNLEDFAGTEIETKAGETLSIWFNLYSETPFRRSEVTVLILSSNFITCEGKPIITDTIRIQLKN